MADGNPRAKAIDKTVNQYRPSASARAAEQQLRRSAQFGHAGIAGRRFDRRHCGRQPAACHTGARANCPRAIWAAARIKSRHV